MGKMTLQYLTAGALIRGQIKNLFRDIEMQGGTVTYNEHKGFFETTFTNIRIEADDHIIRQVHRIISDATGRMI